MGMVQCEAHGLRGITLACPHVHAAWLADERIALTWIDLGWGRVPACAACAPARPFDLAKDEEIEWFIAQELKPACGACFGAWERGPAG